MLIASASGQTRIRMHGKPCDAGDGQQRHGRPYADGFKHPQGHAGGPGRIFGGSEALTHQILAAIEGERGPCDISGVLSSKESNHIRDFFPVT